MNYKRINRALKSMGIKETDRMALSGIIKSEEKEMMEKAIILMLAAPLNVLLGDEVWPRDEVKEKSSKFCEDCLSIIESWSAHALSYEELSNYIYEETGISIEALWAARGDVVELVKKED